MSDYPDSIFVRVRVATINKSYEELRSIYPDPPTLGFSSFCPITQSLGGNWRANPFGASPDNGATIYSLPYKAVVFMDKFDESVRSGVGKPTRGISFRMYRDMRG